MEINTPVSLITSTIISFLSLRYMHHRDDYHLPLVLRLLRFGSEVTRALCCASFFFLGFLGLYGFVFSVETGNSCRGS